MASRASDTTQTVTVEFDPHDVIDIIKTLRAVLDDETLRIIAHAELARQRAS
jgi:hypothetical protein